MAIDRNVQRVKGRAKPAAAGVMQASVLVAPVRDTHEKWGNMPLKYSIEKGIKRGYESNAGRPSRPGVDSVLAGNAKLAACYHSSREEILVGKYVFYSMIIYTIILLLY